MLMPARNVSEMQFGSPKAMREANGMQEAENHRGTQLVTQALNIDAKDLIYVYNLTDFPVVIEQPPNFKRYVVPARRAGARFGLNLLPRYTKDPFVKPGTTEHYYAIKDGRQAANSLMNPDAHPDNPWGAQLNENTRFGNNDQSGNNFNALGCFWSLTPPDDPKLDAEIKLFADRYDRTMRALVNEGEEFWAGKQLNRLTPMHHRAMDHFNLQSEWHRSNVRMAPCPNCGEFVREGIAYHKNEFGDRCIIDQARYDKSIGVQRPVEAPIQASAAISPKNDPVELSAPIEKRLEDMSEAELAAVAQGFPEAKPAVKKKAGK